MNVSKENITFLLLMILMLGAGWIGGAFVALPVLLLLTYVSIKFQRYTDLFIGFIFILICSDNIPEEQLMGLAFTKSLKNIYMIILALTVFIDRRFFKSINPFFVRFAPFFLVAFIALYETQTVVVGLQKTISYFLLFITIPTYIQACYAHTGERFFKRIIYLVMFVLVISIAFRFLLPEVGTSHGGRFRGLFGNPNGIGIFAIVSTILFVILRSYYSNLFRPTFSLLLYAFLFLTAFWSGSRTALVSIVMFLCFYQLFKFSQVLGLLAFFGVLLFIQPLIELVLGSITSAGLGDNVRLDNLEEGSGRLIAWEFAWKNIQDYYFLGRGFAYDEFLMRVNLQVLSRLGHEGGVHNTYLILWLNTGLIGIIFYFRAFFLNFFNASKLTRFAFPAMFSIMFSITFEPWMASSLNPFTSLFLIVLVLISQPQFIDVSQNLEHLSYGEEESQENLEKEVVPI